MNILFVLEYYYPNIGGVEKLFKSLAEDLVKNNHSVTVVTTQFRSTLKKREKINGVDVIRLPLHNRFYFTFFSWISVVRLAKNADLIHTTSYNAAIPAYIAGLLRRKKVIITFHEVWGKLWFKLPFLNSFQRLGFFVFEQIIIRLPFYQFIAVSNSTAKMLETAGVKKAKITRIYNGIEYKDFETKKKDQGSFSYTYFGRLGVSKAMDILLKAASQFNQKHKNAHFNFVVPRIPERLFGKVSKLLNQLEFKGRVNIYHELERNQLEKLILNSSCVVIPSYSEGFCFAAVESCAMNVPVISSGNGALKEVVSGRYITMKNQSVEGLFNALEKALKNEWEEKPLIKFDLHEKVKNYESLYYSIPT